MVAISILSGTPIAAAANNGQNVTITFPAGVQQNDIVVLWGGHAIRSGGDHGPLTSGYAQWGNDSTSPAGSVWWKRMGSTPDTSVQGAGSGNTADATAYGIYILRGCLTTGDPLNEIINISGIDPSSVTVDAAGEIVLVLGLGTPGAADTSPGTVTGYTVPTIAGTANAADTNDAIVYAAHLLNASAGVQNPPAWSTLTNTLVHMWTLAIREGSTTPTLTPTAIGSGDAFGTLVLTKMLTIIDSPGSPASAEAFGSPTLSLSGGATSLAPTAIASAEAFPGAGAGSVTHVATQTNSGSAQDPVTCPFTSVDGQYAIATFSINGGAVITDPAGWTKLYEEPTLSNPTYRVYGKRLDGTETTISIDINTALDFTAQVSRYSGVDAADPWDVDPTGIEYTNTATINYIAPDIAAGTAGRMLVGGTGANSSSPTFTQPSGWNERYDPGALKIQDYADKADATGASVDDPTWVISAGRAGVAWSGALKPSTGGVVVTATPAPKTYYIHPSSGSDSNNGESSGAAWQTFTPLNAKTLNPGDRVYVATGFTYNQAMVLQGGGSTGNYVEVTSYGGGADPIIDGGGTDTTVGVRTPVSIDANYLRFFGFQIQHAAYEGVEVNGDFVEVTDCLVTHNPVGVFQQNTATGTYIANNSFVDNNIVIVGGGANDDSAAFGVLLQGTGALVELNSFSGHRGVSPDYGFDGSAVEIYGATNSLIRQNTSYGDEAFCEIGNAASDNNVLRQNLIVSPHDEATALVCQGTGTFGPVTNTEFHQNTVYYTGVDSQGIVYGTGCTGKVYNNIIQVVWKAGFTPSTGVEEDDNHYYGHTQNQIDSTLNGGVGIGPNSVDGTDPLFVNPGVSDFRLQSGSIDVGTGNVTYGGPNRGYHTTGSLFVVSPGAIASAQTMGSPTISAGAGATSLAPSSIASAQAIGSPTLSTVVTSSPTAIASAQVMGSPTLSTLVTSTPTSIASAQAMGSPVISGQTTLSPTGLATAAVFGSPVLSPLVAVAPGSIASAEAFGTTVLTPKLTSTPTPIASLEALGSLTLTPKITSAPTAINSAEAFGTPVISGQVTLTPTAIASAQAMGTPVLTSFSLLSPTSINSSEAFGFPTMGVPFTLAPTSIASAEAVGAPSLGVPFTLTSTGITSAEALGAPVLTPKVTSTPNSIASSEAVSNPVLSTLLGVVPTAIASAQAMGSPTLAAFITALPSAIASLQAMGTPTLSGQTTLSPSSKASEEALGSPNLGGQNTASPNAVASAQAFGTPTLTTQVSVLPTGIVTVSVVNSPVLGTVIAVSASSVTSGETFGIVGIGLGAVGVSPQSITSLEGLGLPIVTSLAPGAQTLNPGSIGSALAFGVPVITSEVTLLPFSIVTAEALGSPSLLSTLLVTPSAIISQTAVGTPQLEALTTISPASVASFEAFGLPIVTIDLGSIPDIVMTASLLARNKHAVLLRRLKIAEIAPREKITRIRRRVEVP